MVNPERHQTVVHVGIVTKDVEKHMKAHYYVRDKKEKGNCKNQFQGRFYLLGNKGRIPNRCMINLYHFLVEYVATIHIALEESNIDRSKPIKILLNSANDDHALPSSTFAPLLAAVLGYQNPNVVNVNNLYYKPVLSTKLCVKELVIGWATSKIWYHNPNQREKINPSQILPKRHDKTTRLNP